MTNKNGFTLIEILLSLVLISLMGALIFPSFNRSRDKQRLKSFLRKTEGLFSYMQSEALQANRPYRIRFDFSLLQLSVQTFMNGQWVDNQSILRHPLAIPRWIQMDTEKMDDYQKVYFVTVDKDGVSDNLDFYGVIKNKKFVMKISTQTGVFYEEYSKE